MTTEDLKAEYVQALQDLQTVVTNTQSKPLGMFVQILWDNGNVMNSKKIQKELNSLTAIGIFEMAKDGLLKEIIKQSETKEIS